MSLLEFEAEKQIVINRSCMLIFFYKVDVYKWLVEVNLPGSIKNNEPVAIHHWHPCTMTLNSIEAFECYKNLLNAKGCKTHQVAKRKRARK